MTLETLARGIELLCQYHCCSVSELAIRLNIREESLHALVVGKESTASAVLRLQQALQEGNSSRDWRISRAASARVISTPDGQKAARRLSNSCHEIRLATAQQEVLPVRATSTVLILVLAGELEIHSITRNVRLGAGDSLEGVSELLQLKNTGTAPVRFMVIWWNDNTR